MGVRWALLVVGLLVIGACGPIGEPQPVLLAPTVTPNLPTPLSIPSATRVLITDTPTATQTPPPTLTATITATPTPTVTPIALGEIVVAVRPIPAGAAIPPEAVQRMPWPAESVPAQAVTTLDEAVNQVALVDFACYEPLLSEGVARREVGSGFEPLPNTCDALNGPPSMVLVDVVVAVQPLTAGTVIPPSAVALRPWPVGLVPPGALTSLADAVGQTVAIDLNREQPVLAGKLTPGS